MSDWKDHLRSAEGYLGLEMFDHVEQRLEEISPEDRARPEVIGFRVFLYTAAKNWEKAMEVARRMTEVDPGEAQWWVSYAYACRRAESIEAAEKIMKAALARHAEEAVLWFNLACYCCVTGRLEEAERHLVKAAGLDKSYQILALSDSDLKPLWPTVADWE